MAQSKAEIDLDVAQKPASNKKHLMLYLIIGLLVVGLGATIALLLTKSEQPAQPGLTVRQATYLPMAPFVVNFAERGPARFLQVEIQVMAFDPVVLAALEAHTPVIRNDINMLLAAETFDTVSTREGKEKLREAIKTTIQRILGEHQVSGSIEAVYFTSFVMQ